MRSEILEVIKAFAESRLPQSDFDAWWLHHADEVATEIGRFAFLAIHKKGFVGLHEVLERERIIHTSSANHCQACGEKLFVFEPGKTTADQVIAFALIRRREGSKLENKTSWLHPGKYCLNGCTSQLWNLR